MWPPGCATSAACGAPPTPIVPSAARGLLPVPATLWHPAHPTLLAAQAGLAGLSESEYDAVRGGAVVFLGTLARHLDPENPKVKELL